jgi:hypothetical protein
MTLQNAANLSHYIDQIDNIAARSAVTKPEATPPVYGGPQRDAINSVVDNILVDICGKIRELRGTLDAIEQVVLESAAQSKSTLNEHVDVCVEVDGELRRMQSVVASLKAATHGS